MRFHKSLLSSVVACLTLGLTACGSGEGLENPAADSTTPSLVATQALRGMTCAKGAEDDGYMCLNVLDGWCWLNYNMSCYDAAYNACLPLYSSAITQCDQGVVRVYRTVGGRGLGSVHRETMTPEVGSKIEATYYFSPTPVAGADQRPIYRCRFSKFNNEGDFTTYDPNCEGKGSSNAVAFHGYSYAPTTAGATAVYRCRTGSDHFLSRDSRCEGKTVEGSIFTAYAK